MSEDLQSLLKTLTGPEKRFVRKQIGGDLNSARVRLLNLFWDGKEVQDERIRTAIGGRTGKHQPHVICHQLFKAILEALRVFHSDQDENNLQNGIQEADLLYKRTLYKPALKQLQELFKRAQESERHLLALEILNRILELHQVMGRQLTSTEVEGIFAVENKLHSDLSDILKVKQDSGRLFFEMRRTGQTGRARQLAGLEKVLKDPFYRKESSISSFRSGVGYYQLKALLHQLNGKVSKALVYHRKLVVFLEKHRAQVAARPLFYLSCINNLALAHSVLNQPVEVMKCIQKLREAPGVFGFKDSNEWKTRVFTTLYPILHSMYIQHGLFNRAEKIIADTERFLAELGKNFSPFHEQLIRYNLAYLYFGRKEFRFCLRELQVLLRQGGPAVRADLFLNARLMELLVYFEQKEEDTFLYGTINFIRFLKKRDPGERSVQLVLNFLKKELRNGKGRSGDRKELIQRITPLWKSSASSDTFDLMRWLSTFSA